MQIKTNLASSVFKKDMAIKDSIVRFTETLGNISDFLERYHTKAPFPSSGFGYFTVGNSGSGST